MSYILRPYQEEAVQANLEFFNEKKPGNVIQVVSTGAGKSLLIAETVRRLGEPALILQPSKEILEQNIGKYRTYGFDASIYSASFKEKIVSQVTYATIGSIVKKPELFKHFKYLLVDESHGVNSKGGMYDSFIKAIGDTKVLGLTATPYRLSVSSFGPMLKFLTRTRPRIFSDVNYVVQNKTLFDQGFLCPVKYFDMRPYLEYDRRKIISNSNGSEFDDDAMKAYMDSIDFTKFLVKSIHRLLEINRRIVVFVRFTAQAKEIANYFGDEVQWISAETPGPERTELIRRWKAGEIKALVNVGILTTGIDYPELDTVIMGRSTKSLSLYYQMCLDMETEILTFRGFMKHKDIRSTDLVAAYKEGVLIWTPIKQIVHRKVYPGERFVEFKNQHLNMRVTEEHDLLFKSKNARSYSKRQAKELFEMKDMIRIPVSGEMYQEGLNTLTDDEVKFLGVFLSDGSISKHNNSIHIVQGTNYPDRINEIKRLVESCGMKYGTLTQKRKGDLAKYADVWKLSISFGKPIGRDKEKRGWSYLSDFIDKNMNINYETLSSRQFDILLAGVNLGDGNKRVAPDYEIATYTLAMGCNEIYTDNFQSLAVRRGYRCNKRAAIQEGGTAPQFILRVKKLNSSTMAGYNVKDGCISGKKPYKRSKPVFT